MRLLVASLGAACVVILAACGASTDSSSREVDPGVLVGKNYSSTSVTGTPIPGGGPMQVSFPETGRISATAGCKRHNGALTFVDNTFRTDKLATTMMACPPPRDGADKWLSDFLSDSVTWDLEGTTLTLTHGSTKVVLTESSSQS